MQYQILVQPVARLYIIHDPQRMSLFFSMLLYHEKNKKRSTQLRQKALIV